MNFESLETRRMLSVSVNLDSTGLLTVTGTKKDEEIHLGSKKNYVQLLDQYGNANSIDFGKVNRVVINMMGGNDVVVLNDSIHVPVTLIGGSGNDYLRAGGGDDMLIADAGDTLCGGDGFDTADFSNATSGVKFDMSDATVEAVSGSPFADSITGSNANEIILGQGGNDTINGNGGDDYIDGGTGKDKLFGGSGDDVFVNYDASADTLDGGSGTDFAEQHDLDTMSSIEFIFDQTMIEDSGGTDSGGSDSGGIDSGGTESGGVDSGGETMTSAMAANVRAALALQVAAVNVASLDNGVLTINGDANANSISVILDSTGKNISISRDGASASFPVASVRSISIDAGAGNDSISLQKSDGTRAVKVPAVILGGEGNDNIVGGAGNDTISGGNGNDRILGMVGRDSLSGGMGNDSLDGGADDDYLNGGSADIGVPDGADVISGGAGFSDSVIYSMRGDNLSVDISNGSKANDGAAGEGDNIKSDVENIFGGTGNDTLIGNAGANLISGNAGNDVIRGNGGHDKLLGGVGRDTLSNVGADSTIFSILDLGRDDFDATLDANGRVTGDFISGDIAIDFSSVTGRALE